VVKIQIRALPIILTERGFPNLLTPGPLRSPFQDAQRGTARHPTTNPALELENCPHREGRFEIGARQVVQRARSGNVIGCHWQLGLALAILGYIGGSQDRSKNRL
jgi:hypothetical protein